MPAARKLLTAFSRWQRDDDSYQPKPEGHGSARALESNELEPDRPIPLPAAICFLSSPSYVDLPNIPDEERIGAICTKFYNSIAKQKSDHAFEVAARLRCCGNLVGNKCLFEWLDPWAAANNVSCVYCKATFCDEFAKINTTEGVQSHVDLIDWGTQIQQREPDFNARAQTWQIKGRNVKHRLVEASREVEQFRSEVEQEVLHQTGIGNASQLAAFKGMPQALLDNHLHQGLLIGMRL